jgi:hypothetical protein
VTRALRWRIRSAATVAALTGMERGVFALLRLRYRDDDYVLTARRRVVTRITTGCSASALSTLRPHWPLAVVGCSSPIGTRPRAIWSAAWSTCFTGFCVQLCDRHGARDQPALRALTAGERSA